MRKWLAILPPYVSVWAGLFVFHSAWGALIAFHVSILLVLALFRAPFPWKALFKTSHVMWMLASAFLFSLSGLVPYLAWRHLSVSANLAAQVKLLGLTSETWLPFILYFSLINPLVEEYFWRGFLGSSAASLQLVDVAFAGYHTLILWGRVSFPFIIAALISLLFAGWVWRQIQRMDNGFLFVPVIGHMAADLSILACIYVRTT